MVMLMMHEVRSKQRAQAWLAAQKDIQSATSAQDIFPLDSTNMECAVAACLRCLPDLPEHSAAVQEGEGSIGCCSVGCDVEAFHKVCQIVGGGVIHIGLINDHINLHISDTAGQLLPYLDHCAVQTLFCCVISSDKASKTS